MSRQLGGATSDTNAPSDGATAPGVASPITTVSFLVAGLRRRWRLWVATSVAGIVVAIAFSMAVPPDHSATTTLLLDHPESTDPTRAMATDAELIKTRTVAQRVIRRLGLGMPERELISTYQVTALSDQILQLRVTGPTPAEAVRRANAVTEEFLGFRRGELERQAKVVVDTLEERKGALTSELATVNDRINAFPTGAGDAAVRELGDLLTRRAVLDDQIAQLRQRIDAAILDPTLIVERSRVIDPAASDDRSPLKALVANMAAGLVGGLAVGAGWVVIHEVITSDRIRRREDVVAALGVPVPVSIRSLRGSLSAQRRRFRRQLRKPRSDVSRVVRHLRRCLSSQGTGVPALAVVSVDTDGPAALGVASTGIELLNEGKNVLLVDLSSSSALARVLDVPADRTSTLRPRRTSSALRIAFPPPDVHGTTGRRSERELDALGHQADVVLVLATVDPAGGAWHLFEWATTAVAVVMPGRTTATALRSTAELVRAAGLDLDSAILVGAEATDDSVGLTNTAEPTAAVDAPPLRTTR
jgi:capsular polysaccharide biosynthesis protein